MEIQFKSANINDNENILSKFQKEIKNPTPENTYEFISLEIIALMKQLKNIPLDMPTSKEQEDKITDSLIFLNLLLRSVQNDVDYQNYAQLSQDEKDFIRNEVLPLIYT